MSATARPQISACPACSAAPSAGAIAAMGEATSARIMLSIPAVHCAACISSVERTLENTEGVTSARVNLTLKRVSIEAVPQVGPEDMIGVLAGIGYEAHELDPGTIAATETGKRGRELLMRLAVAGFAMMNVMLLSIAVWGGASDATRDLFHWISALIALPAIAFSAQPFFRSAKSVLQVGRLNMDVPISLAIVLAAGMSVYETWLGGEHAYFDAALSLTFFLLAGRYLDHRTRAIARSAAEELAALEVPRAERLLDGVPETVAISDIAVGDLVLVKPGGRMPVDGVVVDGTSELDRSLITGETVPVFAGPDTVVSTGEVNLTGPLTVRVTAAGKDTSLHRMADLVAMAESSKNRYTSLADKAAGIYAPGVHLLSFLAFGGWMYITGGDIRVSLNIAVAVLIITCPCALGLAVPAVTTAASGRMFRKGMLIKSSTAIERLAEVDTVVFDKTGTLTRGVPLLTNFKGIARQDMEIALALARASSHPLSQGIRLAAQEAGVDPADVDNISEVPGYGVSGLWNGVVVRLGRGRWLGVDTAPDVTATYLQTGGDAPVLFTFRDRLRDGAGAVVAKMKARGMAVHLLSGDTPGAVATLAAELGIDHWTAEALPVDKAGYIAGLSASGARVLMVGDGLNDTAALTAAHVSISPASALDAARVASDIVLLGTDMEPLGDALEIAKKATRRIKENFAIAVLYNLVAVPVALTGFATPLVAALAMSASSITVSLNALRLR
jgi:Cu2+-exporting ATPase